MLIEEWNDSGIFTLKILDNEDERGVFRKLVNSKLKFPKIEEISYVRNQSSGVLRGLHFQEAPFAESKIIIVLDGAVFDVLVDLRSIEEASPVVYTFWLGESHDFQGLVVPSNYAHGYLSTSDSSSILYAMDKPYEPNFARGLRWNDPFLEIEWPITDAIISERDKNWPNIERL